MTFPLVKLPERFRDAISAQAAVGDYPIESVGTAALAFASFATQGLFDVYDPARRHPIPLSQYFMVLMGSGDAKSSVYRLMKSSVNQWHADQRPIYDAETQAFQIEQEKWDADYKSASKTSSPMDLIERQRLLENKPVRPRDRENLSSKATTNGLFATLQSGWPSHGLFSDEAGSQLAGHSLQAKNSPAEFAAALTSLWDNGQMDRVTGVERMIIRGKRLSAFLMVQPEVASQFLTDPTLKAQGIHGRIHIVQPPAWVMPVLPFADPVEIERQERLEARVRRFSDRLYALLDEALTTPHDGEISPAVLHWTSEAADAAQAALAICVARRTQSDLTYWKRTWEHMVRMAGVLTAFEGHPKITVEAVDAAMALVDFYANHWRDLDVGMMSERDTTRDLPKQKLLKRLKSEGPQTARELSRSVLRGMNNDVRDKVINELLSDEYIERFESLSGTQKTICYRIKA